MNLPLKNIIKKIINKFDIGMLILVCASNLALTFTPFGILLISELNIYIALIISVILGSLFTASMFAFYVRSIENLLEGLKNDIEKELKS